MASRKAIPERMSVGNTVAGILDGTLAPSTLGWRGVQKLARYIHNHRQDWYERQVERRRWKDTKAREEGLLTRLATAKARSTELEEQIVEYQRELARWSPNANTKRKPR